MGRTPQLVGGTCAPSFEQHGGDRECHGAEDEASWAEEHQTAYDGDEGDNGVQFELFPDKRRTQQIVDGADNEYAPDSKDEGVPPTAFKCEK